MKVYYSFIWFRCPLGGGYIVLFRNTEYLIWKEKEGHEPLEALISWDFHIKYWCQCGARSEFSFFFNIYEEKLQRMDESNQDLKSGT